MINKQLLFRKKQFKRSAIQKIINQIKLTNLLKRNQMLKEDQSAVKRAKILRSNKIIKLKISAIAKKIQQTIKIKLT